MTATDPTKPPTRLEQDTAGILVWLAHNAGRELSYSDISRGTGIPDTPRLRRAVAQARKAAELLGDRLETFYRSKDPRRHGMSVTRYNLAGKGDDLSSRDALHTARVAIAAMKDMRRSCAYEGENIHGFAPKAFKEIAGAVDGCIRTVSGVEQLSDEVFKLQRKHDAMARRIAELEAQVAQATAPQDPYVTA
jgi:hypothetical protein